MCLFSYNIISIIASSIYHDLNEWSKISIQRQILNAELDVGIPVYFGFIIISIKICNLPYV